ncbi:hypothetical protein SAMN05443144_106107 [Fodinibius roseus]|uniref:SH3 domain-containing protein n=1 Tax=Fodinibius roseus TaxID=1194090 RepID=A0A1M4ZRL2_9BACT|nr:hypothetical protein SAMN05443144_106107 [Fodinibius roseus]
MLQRILLLIFLCGAIPVSGDAQQRPQALFDEANKLLSSGQNMEAVQRYQQLENQQNLSGALFLNLGIAYQRVDSLGKAKYYYLKSSQFEETATRAEQMLDYINKQFSHQSAILPKLPWDVATHWLQDNIGARTLLGAGLILFNMGILFFIARWFIRGLPRAVKTISFTIVGLAVAIMATAFYTQYVSNRYSVAVMVTEDAPVAETPREDASLVSQAFEGYTFTVDHKRSNAQPEWSYVRMSNGLYGWIPTKEIMIL